MSQASGCPLAGATSRQLVAARIFPGYTLIVNAQIFQPHQPDYDFPDHVCAIKGFRRAGRIVAHVVFLNAHGGFSFTDYDAHRVRRAAAVPLLCCLRLVAMRARVVARTSSNSFAATVQPAHLRLRLRPLLVSLHIFL